MKAHEKRIDHLTATAVSEAMFLLHTTGCSEACAHLKEVGVSPELVERMLLIRYDRRRPINENTADRQVL